MLDSMMTDLSTALILMIGAAILAGLIVYLIMRSRYQSLMDRFNQKVGELSELQNRFNLLQTKFDTLEKQHAELKTSLRDLEVKYDQQRGQLADCSSRRTELESEIMVLTPFRSKYQKLAPEHDLSLKKIDELNVGLNNLQFKHDGLADALRGEKNENKTLNDELLRLKPFVSKYNSLSTEYTSLKDAYDALKAKYEGLEDKLEDTEDLVEKAEEEAEKAKKAAKKAKESEAEILARIKERAKDINFDRIGVATYEDRDDLKLIKGIGPFIEKKLHSIGIYTFRQIANFTPEDEDKVNEVIEFFPGRIRRDNWSKQGEEFADNKEKSEKENA